MADDKKRQMMRTQGRFSSSPKEITGNKVAEKKKRNKRNEGTEGGSTETHQTDIDIKDSVDSTSEDELHNQARIYGFPSEHKVVYEENSQYSFPQLDAPKKAEEIKEAGMRVLSNTSHGESRIYYYPHFLDLCKAYIVFDKFREGTDWRQMNVTIRGKEYPQPRLVAWYGPFPYAYSGVMLEPREMTEDILEIKKKIESMLANVNINATFNSVLLNLYETGSHSVAWHSDDELSLGVDPTIASVSLGEIRKFELRRKVIMGEEESPVDYFVNLKTGSLFIMDGAMQADWQHRIPKEPSKVCRINLTFRNVYKDERLLKMTN